MNLDTNYKLLDVLRDDGIRTCRAEELASGRELQIHLFVNADDRALFEQVRSLPLSARRPILDFGDERSIPYLITDPLPDETEARAWLTVLVSRYTSPIDGKPKPKPIKSSVWKTGTPMPDPLFPPDPQEEKTPAIDLDATADKEPGEFTRMFQRPDGALSPEKPASKQGSEPGEFTRMFERPPEPRSLGAPPDRRTPASSSDPSDLEATVLFSASQPAARSEAEPSDFSRMFESPLSPAGSAAGASRDPFALEPAAAPPPPPPPGEFTRMFGPPGKTAEPLGSGADAHFSGLATGAFEPPVPPPVRSASPQGKDAGPLTRMMTPGAVPTLGQPQPGENQAPAKGKNANLPLIIILASLAIFAVLIVLFFAIHRG